MSIYKHRELSMFAESMGKKTKYYVVWEGIKPGIYNTWAECQAQIKGYPNAKYRSYPTLEEAVIASKGAPDLSKKTKSKPQIADRSKWAAQGVILDSFCVDAACSGNPGVMEYRGVWTRDNSELFKMGPYQGGTNNIGEFLALVHALALFNKLNKPNMTIYSDSRTAMAWVRNKQVKTTLKQTDQNRDLFIMMNRALNWIKTNTHNHTILKWDTKGWGEIPADFGRK